MARFALALAAIMILILSAGLTHDQSQTMPRSAGSASAAAFHGNTDALRSELMLIGRATTIPMTQHSTSEEPPALALLVYLALIILGGVWSVALVRRRLHGEA